MPKQPKPIGKCALCLIDAQLRKSHVIPETWYKDLYDEKHKIVVTSTSPQVKTHQKSMGIYEPGLLCAACETKLGALDQYAREAIPRNIASIPIPPEGRVCLENVDYRKFKLFLLSLLWRASVARRDEFKLVALRDEEKRLRSMLITEDPGNPKDYGCVLVAPISKRLFYSTMIAMPRRVKDDEVHAVHMFFGGLSWLFFVPEVDDEMLSKELVITADNRLSIYFEDGWIEGDLHRLRRAELKRRASH